MVDYVLGKFTLEQQGPLSEALDKTVKALDEWVAGTDFAKLENQFN